MMLFQRRLFMELMWNGLSTMLGLLVVLLLIMSAKIVHEVEGLSITIFLRTVPVFAATALDLVLPVSVLVAVVVTYARATSDNETDTLRASGVSPLHLFTPALFFGAIMTLVLLFTTDWAKPWAQLAQKRLSKTTDMMGLLESRLSSGEPVRIDARHVISAEAIAPDGTPTGIRLQQFAEDGALEREIFADRGEIVVNRARNEFELNLQDWHSVRGPPARGRVWTVSLPLSVEMAEVKLDYQTTPQLMAWLQREPGRREKFKEEEVLGLLQLRLASAVTCILFVFLGLPVAMLFRRHDRVGAYLVAFLLALFIYYPSLRLSSVLTENRLLPLAVSTWGGSALMLLIGLALSGASRAPMISRLDRYVARVWMWNFTVAAVFFVGLVGVFDFFGKLDEFLENETGQETARLVVRFYLYSTPAILLQVEPFVMLAAALFTITRLQRHNEFMAMLQTGRSQLRVVAPVFVLTALFIGGMVWMQESVAPRVAKDKLELESRLLHEGHLVIDEVDLKDSQGRDLRARDYRVEEGVVGQLYVSFHDRDGRNVSIEGKEAVYDGASGGWRLRDGTCEIRGRDGLPVTAEAAFAPTDIGPEDLLAEELEEFDLSYAEVLDRSERYPLSRRFRLLRHYHVTFPLSVMLLVLLGTPIVLRRRTTGRWAGLGYAFLLAVVYMFADAMLRDLGKDGAILPVLAVWTPVILAGSLAVVLLDSVDR